MEKRTFITVNEEDLETVKEVIRERNLSLNPDGPKLLGFSLAIHMIIREWVEYRKKLQIK